MRHSRATTNERGVALVAAMLLTTFVAGVVACFAALVLNHQRAQDPCDDPTRTEISRTSSAGATTSLEDCTATPTTPCSELPESPDAGSPAAPK
ncbi:MAG TPA: hypothetical protein VG871_15800 [Vicinamibacterales bacterium]|nr:hypothetical protein [Vicinamibacterales bacterium]